ncbi:MAG: macrolide ABC transporter ATP-binding protein [Candidatus Wallbacteria bacterium GWC2_49_35]|uniref:Macrolide ABC transporter ATP-binding protein n=1 Tax=Candidatus Wallbacteria bacterium GWC2_49_35 TaxID=1817813 RepID=A0A1F7WUY8_9BACT|nr:MAG: macrolide ABC transporter ATP-binding protein [Candidatus Wallbacteria bacterium GWC2_49_35]HBC76544.1 macrolide ABC transporter ATP-binding protein [Candidatus Wallbacteria bacterium]
MPDDKKAVIEIKALTKVYDTGVIKVNALNGVDFSISEGELIAIMGPSGSGKSTMMNVIGCLDMPTAGSYHLDGTDVSTMSEDALADIRNQKIGFVFQTFNLLARTSALKNVELPMVYAKLPAAEREERAIKALNAVGLGERMHHMPNELSGGQQQRVAIARALVNDPKIILADEPTGNLDSRSSEEILMIFQELNRSGKTIVLVTHEPDIAQHCKRNVVFRDGVIIADKKVEKILDARVVLEELTKISRDMHLHHA